MNFNCTESLLFLVDIALRNLLAGRILNIHQSAIFSFPLFITELPVEDSDHSFIYNHTLAKTLVEYASAVSYNFPYFFFLTDFVFQRIFTVSKYFHLFFFVKVSLIS